MVKTDYSHLSLRHFCFLTFWGSGSASEASGRIPSNCFCQEYLSSEFEPLNIFLLKLKKIGIFDLFNETND